MMNKSTIGAALARLWEFDGSHLVKVLDTHGMSTACPITCEPFVCPVMLCDGQIYEETSISSWLQTSETSPSTNLPVRHKSLLSLTPLKDMLEAWLLHSSVAGHVSRSALRRHLKSVGTAQGNLRSVRAAGEALHALEGCITQSLAEISDWCAAVDTAREVAEVADVSLREAAALQLQTTYRSSRARAWLVRAKAGAARIRRCWRSHMKTRHPISAY